MLTVTAPLWLWNGEKGSWHFLTVPVEQAVEVRLLTIGPRNAFGSIKVEASIGDVRWRTSLFPVSKTGEYVLPVKADVRRRAGIAAGDEVMVSLELASA